jgi:hypothetical protein
MQDVFEEEAIVTREPASVRGSSTEGEVPRARARAPHRQPPR